MAQQQQQQGMPPPPPMPSEEQMALSDATFRQVPLSLDPNSLQLGSPSHDLTILNALVRSLRALPPQVPFPPPPNVVPPQRSMAIGKAKDEGNVAYRKGDYAEAIKLFTLALDVAASRPLWESNQLARDEMALCLANRSAAFAQDLKKAINDLSTGAANKVTASS
ncbi:hypothetical protein FA10DRAFT_100288 [Acaromyces ingoldii]|uniref:Translocation protein SEC72 n=1 Tax=Acaromyces ingoldii TaxID=215250 RepID=A0A316YQ82_9BASI|nr:hypothetical protein FA10DRAFT_100288 [Acaromyces ingoldii]PWN89915.1 hypothetical protein FA10DRAFT_100288 [Acaromyces ingoldii]